MIALIHVILVVITWTLIDVDEDHVINFAADILKMGVYQRLMNLEMSGGCFYIPNPVSLVEILPPCLGQGQCIEVLVILPLISSLSSHKNRLVVQFAAFFPASYCTFEGYQSLNYVELNCFVPCKLCRTMFFLNQEACLLLQMCIC